MDLNKRVPLAGLFVVLAALGICHNVSAQGAVGEAIPAPPRTLLPGSELPGSGGRPTKTTQAEQDLSDPTRAYDPNTGQNLYWDCVKKTWVDSKTGKSVGFQGARAADGEAIPAPPRTLLPGSELPGSGGRPTKTTQAEQDLSDPTRAYDPNTGQNLFWDRDKKTWIDSKTGRSVGFRGVRATKACPPPEPHASNPPQTPPPPPTKPDKNSHSSVPGARDLSGSVLAEVNWARADPAAYALTFGKGGRTPATTEAIAFLEHQSPLPPLTENAMLDAAAARHAADQGPAGLTGHIGADGSTASTQIQNAGMWSSIVAEDISLGQASAGGVVRQWIIDEGVPSRAHRSDLFNPLVQFAGVGCGPHKTYRSMCVIDLSGAPIAR
jgi:hypothetical protein